MTAIVIILFFILVMVCILATMKIKGLEERKHQLEEERSKLSNALRLKGIAVDRLTREIKRLEKEGK